MTRGAVLLSFSIAVMGLASPAQAQVRTQLVAAGLSNPVAFVMDPLDHSTFYVVEQRGTIRTLRNGSLAADLFLDIRASISSGGERGLLGMAFPANHAESRRFYVNFTNPDGHTAIAIYEKRARRGRCQLALRFAVARRPAIH